MAATAELRPPGWLGPCPEGTRVGTGSGRVGGLLYLLGRQRPGAEAAAIELRSFLV